MQGFPLLVLALVMTAALGPSLTTVIVAISVPFIPPVARVVRATTLSIREASYVETARALGAERVRVTLRHILPNTLAPLIAPTTAQLGSAILVKTSLSFLGLGVPEPYPEEATTSTNWAMVPCYSNLVLFNPLRGQENGSTLIGELAEKWEWRDGGRALAFTLRGGC
jgi:ABC-type antimicrobial peptide transport system permease subunit